MEHGVNAMTDVTGFGLAGHIKECHTNGFSMEWSDEIDVFDNVAWHGAWYSSDGT